VSGSAPVGVRRLPVPTETRAPARTTNAYLVEGRPADALLVDPGSRTDELDAAVAGGTVGHVAVTHAHPDHVGAVAEYAAETGATVWARGGRQERFAAATGIEPDRTFRGGDRVGPARALSTPGHAPDHAAFVVGDEALVGDLAVAEGSVAVAAPEGDLRAYLATLRRLLVRGFDTLYPGHGPTIADPGQTLERLLEHRLDRERRVLAAVDGGAADLDAVVVRAYGKDLSGVEDLARATARAHLRKLARAGRIDRSWIDVG